MSEAVKYMTYWDGVHRILNSAGQLHSFYDEPAYVNGSYYSYCKNDKWHREDGPARIFEDNQLEYYLISTRYIPKCQKL